MRKAALCVLAAVSAFSFFVQEARTQEPQQARQFKPVKVTRWEDPAQRAFSCEVPADWQAQGGTVQPSSLDVRRFLELQSPDGQIYIRFGDAGLPPFITPLPGFPEGSSYPLGMGNVILVKSYRSGLQFAREYASMCLPQIGQNVQQIAMNDRKDVSDKINKILPSGPAVSMRFSSGDATFSFVREGRQMLGYCFASTLATKGASGATNWSVNDLILSVCPVERKDETRFVVEHAVATAQINPEWAARNSQNVMQTSKAAASVSSYMADTINSVYENRSRSQDRVAQQWSDVILGRERWTDAAGGAYIAPNAYDNFYKMPNGDIIATDSSTPPSRDAQRLDFKKKPY